MEMRHECGRTALQIADYYSHTACAEALKDPQSDGAADGWWGYGPPILLILLTPVLLVLLILLQWCLGFLSVAMGMGARRKDAKHSERTEDAKHSRRAAKAEARRAAKAAARKAAEAAQRQVADMAKREAAEAAAAAAAAAVEASEAAAALAAAEEVQLAAALEESTMLEDEARRGADEASGSVPQGAPQPPEPAAESEVPPELLCPLSFDVMTDSVICASGQTYERSAIEKWFAMGKRTDPMSGSVLKSTFLVPNVALRSMCRRYEQKDS